MDERRTTADHARRFAAELVGTALACTIAMLAAAGTSAGDAGRLAAAAAYGLGVTAAMLACGGTGAVHLNPAVTLAAFTTGRGTLPELAVRVAGQLAGGCCAGLLAMWLLAGQGTAWGMPVGLLTKTDSSKAVVVEAILTMAWAGGFVACGRAGWRGPAAALPVGLVVTAAAAAGLPWTGAAIDPARMLASAVAAGDFSALWQAVAGPLAGGAMAGLAGRWLTTGEPEPRSPAAGADAG